MLFGVPWLFGAFCVSQVAYHRSLSGCPLKMKHGFLITDWHFWQSRPCSCVTPFSHSLSLQGSLSSPPFDWPLYRSLHLPYSYFLLCIPPCLSLDCNKTLALQFVFAPLAPSPAQPQLLPMVHISGSLPSAKGIYSWNYAHCVFQLVPPPPLHYPPPCPETLEKVGLIIKPDIQREWV